MARFDRVNRLTQDLTEAIAEKDAVRMARLYDELSVAICETFAPEDYSFECLKTYCVATIVCLRYRAYNNINGAAIDEGKKTLSMIDTVLSIGEYSKAQNEELKQLRTQIKSIIDPLKPHKNMIVPRKDYRCTLCRVRPANKTGSHMVPNFLAHPTFSWDGKGKRGHEALNHDYLNEMDSNCQFYGSDVPEWRFAQGEGKTEVSDEDIEKNINQLEYDNEFCSICENRFGVIETAYSQFYNGQQKRIDPRVAYLFWLSVLWRMSMGSMGVFMDMHDEWDLRKLLDENILDTDKAIAAATSDLGEWKYAMFRAEGLWSNGDKGIFGSRMENSPYVVMYNDLVMVFFHDDPDDDELTVGPITIDRDNLNDWQAPEKVVTVDRRWFWNVRDWIVDSSYDYADPVREKVLRTIREEERSTGKVVSDYKKKKAIKVARVSSPPQGKILKLRKFQRIGAAWQRLKEAESKGEVYDPLNDEELFLTQTDFQKYYEDLANFSKYRAEAREHISEFPFYEDAKKYVPDETHWMGEGAEDLSDDKYLVAMKDVLGGMSRKKAVRMLQETSEPYENPYRNIGRNDPCPCGSGKKFKKCCGKDL